MIFVESHNGWRPVQGESGEWYIIDQNGWTLATIHYDYRYTCNATNRYRANLIASAPETEAKVHARARRAREHDKN
jgi:hypothetical protein